MSLVRDWLRLGGPRHDRWLAGRIGDQLAATFVLLVETAGGQGARLVLSARGVFSDNYTNGQWVSGFPGGGPDGGWRLREVWRVGAA